MTEQLDIDPERARQFYKALRDHLSRDADGQRLIMAFEKKPKREGAALAAYLRRQLPEDETLANQLAAALGDDDRFATIVTGGHVDQIINIARLGVLSLTIKRYFYVFHSVRQVITFLLIVIAVGAAIAFGVWLSRQPAWMTGDFNIAVAQFEEVPTSDRPTIAPIISSGLFNYLDSTYKTDNLGFDIQVEHDKIDAIHGPAEAAELTKRVNANLVIYGTVFVLGDGASVTPKFWVYDALKNDTTELLGTGQHQLEYPFQFTDREVLDIESGVNSALQQRANILIKFTQALVYRKTRQYQAAHIEVQQAIGEAEVYGDFKGKETLYLIAADIARLNKDLIASRQYVSQALTINPNYARAYIARGNIFYEEHDFQRAYEGYTHALALTDHPDGAHVIERANLGLGNIFSYQFQSQPANSAMADLALTRFGIVSNAYQQSKDLSISELAALAYYGQGVIYQIQNEAGSARHVLEQVLSISDDPLLKQKAQDRLSRLPSN